MVPRGVGPPCSGDLGGQPRRFGSPKRSFRRGETYIFHKTGRSTDRVVVLPGRSNLTLRLRGQVDLRGAGGGSKSGTETLFLKPRKRDQSVRSTDRFVKMSVSLRRNGKFAAESDPPGRFLNDPNEEIGSLQLTGGHGTQIQSSRKLINPSDHGLVLLEPLSVAVLIIF